MSDNIELLTCPFCGSINLVKSPWIECDNCGAMGPIPRDCDNYPGGWNRRAALAQQPAHAAPVPAAQEPVAEVRHTAIGCVDWISFPRDIPSGTKLYTAPPAAEQPDTVAVLRAVLADIAQDAEDSGALLLANRLRNLLAGCAE